MFYQKDLTKGLPKKLVSQNMILYPSKIKNSYE